MPKKNLMNYAFPLLVLALFIGGYFLFVKAPVSQPVEETGWALYFFRDGCHYCELQDPIVEQLLSEGYNITYMDAGVHPEYLQQYSIQGTPTFIASNGDVKVGLTELDALRAWLDQHGAK